MESVVVSRKFDYFCSVHGGTEFISQLQLALEAEGKIIVTDLMIITAILVVNTYFISVKQSATPLSQVSDQSTIPPDISDKSEVHTEVEKDESLPQKKRTKVDTQLVSSDDPAYL